MPINSPVLPVLEDADLDAFIAQMDLQKILEETFAALDNGQVVQPPQMLTPFPGNGGDFITYLGVLGHLGVFGGKLSPYIPTGGAPIITAWTMLMSMQTGLPLLLCDSARLTTERTAATTALAINKLAPARARVLAIIGSGRLAKAHLRHALGLREWHEIRVYSPHLANSIARREAWKKLDPRIICAPSSSECVSGAEVIMLVTSSGKPVIKAGDIGKSALVTSISTNVARAHEIDPALLPGMDVYCDYAATTPDSAGEMLLAVEGGFWSKDKIRGDLASLCSGRAAVPAYDRPVFFRSVGLGIEDVAIAYAIYKQLNG